MTIETKPEVRSSWSEASTTATDFVDPGDTYQGDGWPFSAVPPPRQYWNWLLNRIEVGIHYAMQHGIPEFDTDEDYPQYARCQYNGLTYIAKNATTGEGNPTVNTSDWERWGFSQTELTAIAQTKGVRLARYTTTANVTLSGLGTQAGGDWGGTINAGDVVLVKNNSTASQNGLYVVDSGAWSRSTDFDESSEVLSGTIVTIREGTTLADTMWTLTTDGTITVGSTSLTFSDILVTKAGTQTLTNKSVATGTKGSFGTDLANSQFVSDNAGRLSGVVSLTTSTALTRATHSGAFVRVTGSGVTLTLPLLSAAAAGESYWIKNSDTSNSVTVSRAGSDVIRTNSGATANSITLTAGEGVLITYHGSEWTVALGTGATLPNTGTAGTYDNVTTDAQGRVTAGAIIPRFQCKAVVNSGSVELRRQDGTHIFINGVNRLINATPPSLSASGLTVGNTYYVYAYWTGTDVALEASATAPATDATYSHKIKTGDATRTLVGVGVIGSGPVWTDTGTARHFRSYYNRGVTYGENTITSNATASSTTFTEVTTTLRETFVCFDDDIVDLAYSCCIGVADSNGNGVYTRLTIDGNATTACARHITSNNQLNNAEAHASSIMAVLTTGQHTLALQARSTNSGTMTIYANNVTGEQPKVRIAVFKA